eukprot:TRINITY_DN3376_c0_g2_i1.p1 TRINITY_DN3376_c0_g2~~TRINITY_DN3376_c0_g2_i1.p1  ORF type:complete len:115 (+),score=5.68 TRINITY_DN3376_c0_g2_i1:54-347(+)
MVFAMVIAVMPRSEVDITWRMAPNAVTRRVLESVHFCARPTIENGNQCVGMNEWRIETVAIPPIVDRSLALKPSIFTRRSNRKNLQILETRGHHFQN